MKYKVPAIAVMTAGLALGAAACGSSGTSASSGSATPSSSSASAMPTQSAQTASKPFGPACAAVPSSGSGSFTGMSTAPVATAASNNPAPATLTKVLANKAELTKILTYHVVGAKVTTGDFSMGSQEKTLEGAKVTLGKMGSTYTVNGAKVVCGGVTTANATVYIIGSVLMPKS